jgi:hypothetical protein
MQLQRSLARELERFKKNYSRHKGETLAVTQASVSLAPLGERILPNEISRNKPLNRHHRLAQLSERLLSPTLSSVFNGGEGVPAPVAFRRRVRFRRAPSAWCSRARPRPTEWGEGGHRPGEGSSTGLKRQRNPSSPRFPLQEVHGKGWGEGVLADNNGYRFSKTALRK